MNDDKLKASLVAYGRKLAHLTDEQRQARERAAWDRYWLRQLRKLEDPLQHEFEMDRDEGDTWW